MSYLPRYMGVSGYAGIISYMVFFLVLILLFSGFMPYGYCVFCRLPFTIWFCFIMWIRSVFHFYRCIKISVNFTGRDRGFISSLFFGLIEMVSELSRPVRLTLRLFINVMVGYYLAYVIYLSSNYWAPLMLLIIIPVAIEPFVFIIQRFIFAQIIYLYMND